MTALGVQDSNAVGLNLNFYGERVSIVTDSSELVNQLQTNFLPLIEDSPPDKTMATNSAAIEVHAEGRPLDVLWTEMSGQLVAALAHRFVVLHASAIVVNGQVTLCIGPSRSGKTTLAMAASELGWSLLGDDVVALEWQTGVVYALPLPLRPRSDTALAADRQKRVQSMLERKAKNTLSHTSWPPRLARVLVLGSTGSEGNLTCLFQSLYIRGSADAAIMLKRILHGIEGAHFVHVPELPPVTKSLKPQRELLERLMVTSPHFRHTTNTDATMITAFAGLSMMPTLLPGDRVLWRKLPDRAMPEPGDIIGYKHETRFVAHRVVGIDTTKLMVITRGDAVGHNDLPRHIDGITHLAICAFRGNRRVSLRSQPYPIRVAFILLGRMVVVVAKTRHRFAGRRG